jgi:Fur family ferric uptake transcriptional regulator
MTKLEGYKTRQRELLLQYLIQNKSIHLTVEDMANHLKRKNKPVGKSTIYRYLDKLVSQGLVRKYFVEEGVGACYQYNQAREDCNHHFHLKCTSCGQLLHVKCTYLNSVHQHVLDHHHFLVDHTKTVLYGICHECQTKQNTPKKQSHSPFPAKDLF